MQYNQEKRSEVAKRTIRLTEFQMHEFHLEICEKITQKRIEQNFSYKDLAEMTGISESYLYQILDGKVKNMGIHHILKLMLALELSPEDIFPDRLLKRQEKEVYGEQFEYLIQGLSKEQVQFLMQFTKLYLSYNQEGKQNQEQKGELDG